MLGAKRARSDVSNPLGIIIQGFLHSGHNRVITRAAAEVAGQAASNFITADFLLFVFFDKGRSRHNKTGSTNAALHGAFVHKGLLHSGKFIIAAFAFHSANGSAVGPDRQL